MATHELKIWPQYFEDVLNGSKTFEIRKNDRGYQVGDTLVLQEWVEKARELDFRPPWQERTYGEYTGRECKRTVTYILNGPAFGIEDGFCVMGLADPVKEGRVEALERLYYLHQARRNLLYEISRGVTGMEGLKLNDDLDQIDECIYEAVKELEAMEYGSNSSHARRA